MFKRRFLAVSALAIAAAFPVTGAQAEVDPDDPFTGVYIGIHAGLGRQSFSIGERTVTRPAETVPGANAGDPDIVIPAAPETIPSDSVNSGISLFGGGQIGANYATRSMLIGVEADISYHQGGGTSSQTIQEEPFNDDVAGRVLGSEVNVDAELSGSVRLRAGLRQQDLVYYATAGIAAARVDVTSSGATSVASGVDGIRTVTATDRNTHTGWTAGLGILGWFGGGAIGGIEVRYSDYGSQTYDLAGTVDTPTVPTDIGVSALELFVKMNYLF